LFVGEKEGHSTLFVPDKIIPKPFWIAVVEFKPELCRTEYQHRSVIVSAETFDLLPELGQINLDVPRTP
jgi:hypothetical protein